MATENIKIGIDVVSNTDAETAKAIKLKKAFEDANRAAGNTGGTAGSRAVSAKAAPSGPGMTGAQYNISKGVGGTSARDFADEARGLGGLVRAYATFAANIFAVSAAFTALRDAAQTDNLVKGLNTLGATAGISLGTLSKRLVEATDGAISLRDAMTATAQASSAGMSSKNLERLAVVAKNASTALGVSMSDALSRLSRGITKLEPELLDELGIFTKIGPATEKYALQIGKTASQLSDLERRQAFANAVLEEGETKFNSLSSSSANAYDKLLATVKNAGQEILSSINVILEPIAKFLANNPLIVAASTIGIAATLLKRAIPDLLGDYTRIQAANEKALETQTKSLESSKKLQAQLLQEKAAAEAMAKSAAINADRRLAEADAADTAASKIKQSKSRSAKLDEILGPQTDYADVSKSQLAALEQQAQKFDGKNKKAAESYRSLATAISAYQLELTKESVSTEAAKAATDKLAQSKQRLIVIEKEMQAAQAAAALSNAKLAAANNLQEKGFLGIFSSVGILNKGLKELGTTTGTKFVEIGKFIGSALLGGLGKMLSGLNMVTIAWAALTLLLDLGAAVFSKNAKEMEAFSKAAETAKDSADNVSRTIDALNKKGGFASGTIDGINAMSNAFTELADSAKTATDAAAKAQKSLDFSWWDKAANSIKKLIGGDIANKEADALGAQIENASKIMARVSGGGTATSKLKGMLGITSLDAESASQAFKKLDDVSKGKIVAYLKEFSNELNTTSQKLTNFKTSTDTAYKSLQEFIQSTAVNNPLLKLGQSLQTVGLSMTEIFTSNDPSKMLAAMDDLVKNTEKAALFGPKFVEGIVSVRTEFAQATKEVKGVQDALADNTLELDKQQKIVDKFNKTYGTTPVELKATSSVGQFIDSFSADTAKKETERLQSDRRELNKAVSAGSEKYSDVFKKATLLFTDGLNTAFKSGAEYITKALGQVKEKNALDFARAQAGGLSGENQATKIAQINQKDAELQIQLINTNISLIKSQEDLAATINEANALANAAIVGKNADLPQTAKDQAQSSVAAAQAYKSFVGDVTSNKANTSQKSIESYATGKGLDSFATALFKSLAGKLSSALAGQEAAKETTKGKARAQGETDRQNIESGRFGDLAKISQQEQQILSAKIQQKSILDSIAGVTSQEAILSQQKLDNSLLEKKQSLELEDIQSRMVKAGSDEKEINKLDKEKTSIQERQKLEKDNAGLVVRQKLLNLELDKISQQYELIASNAELQKTTALTKLDYDSQELSLLSSAYDITKEYAIVKQTQLDKERALVETSITMQQVQDVLNKKREDGELRIAELGGSRTSAQAEAILAEIARQETLTKNTISGLSVQYNSKIAVLNKTKEINLEQERYNQLLESSVTFAESLKGAFGEVGAAIGGFVTSLTEVTIQNERNTKALEKATKAKKEAYDSKDVDKIADADLAYNAQKRKSQKDELSGNIKLVSSAKTMFNEKTATYKALDKVEKTMHLYRMAMDAKELAFKVGNAIMGVTAKAGAEAASTGITFAGVAARLPAYIAEIYASWGAMGPWMAAAAGVFIASKLGAFGGGGGGSVPTFSANSEQIQETQGTGMTYDSKGNKVSDIGGILGDDEAKANSIVNSLEILKENSFEGLDYDNKLLRSFENVAGAIGKATNTVLTSGLRTVTSEILEIMSPKKEGGFGSSIPILGGIISGIFGGDRSESSSINSQRLELSGTFYNVSKDIESGLSQVTDVLVKWEEDGGWFGSDDSGSYIKPITGTVPDDIKEAFTSIFDNLEQGYQEIAKMMGNKDSFTFVTDKLKTVELRGPKGNPLKFDYTGLKGDELKTELEAYFSKINNIAIKALFPEFKEFETAGEDYGTTAVRVLQNTKQVRIGLNSIGSAKAGSIGEGLSGFRAADDILKEAGGLDVFADQIKAFSDNFLTEAERLVPKQKAVTDEMNRLGYASVDTREEFKALVQSASISKEDFQSLMNIQAGFLAIRDAEEKALKARTDSWNSFFDKFASASAKASKNTGEITTVFSKFGIQIPKTKAQLFELLETLRRSAPDTADAILDISSALDTYYNSAESFEKVTLSLSNSLKTTSDTLKSQIKTLKDYNTNLLLGSQSALSAKDQYGIAKDQVARLQGIIQGAANTPEEVKTRNDAISSFTGASDTFLKLSSTLFASGPQYLSDFNSIRSAVQSTTSALESQLTDTEKQLEKLTESNTFLQEISTATKTTSEYLGAYLKAGGVSISTASSFAVGTNYVPQDMIAQIHQGERIIPAADNAMLMQNSKNNNAQTQQLVNQIVNLTKQVEELAAVVADGAILNAKATDRNTQEITKVISSANDKAIQSNRLQAKAGIK